MASQSLLFDQQRVQANNKESTKVPHYRPFCVKSTRQHQHHYLNQWWLIGIGIRCHSPEKLHKSAYEFIRKIMFEDWIFEATSSSQIQLINSDPPNAALNRISIGSDNGLSPIRRQSIIWTSAWISLIGPWGTNFNGILIEMQPFLLRKMRLRMSSGKGRPFCLGRNVLLKDWKLCFLALSVECSLPLKQSPASCVKMRHTQPNDEANYLINIDSTLKPD